MGVISKAVKVTVGRRNCNYYKNLGYAFNNIGDEIEVEINDLPKGSDTKVEILCDMCNKNTFFASYGAYNRALKNNGSYVCKECVNIKRMQTMQNRYGICNALQSEEIKEMRRKTMLEKYGVESYTQTKEYKEKTRQTCLEKYGAEHSAKCQETKDKRARTNLLKYGFEYATQNQVIKDKTKTTVNKKYGVDNVFANQDIIKKIHRTMYENDTCAISKQQKYLNRIYKGILNFPYLQYNLDIYLNNENIAIEYNGGGHLNCVKFGNITEEEFNRKEMIRNIYIKQAGMKRVTIQSIHDKLPSDITLIEMLNYARNYFIDYPNHSWIEYDIDNSVVRNAEHKDGILYNYGELRKIKDSDLYNLSESEESIA